MVQGGLASLDGLLQPGALLPPKHRASEAGCARRCASCALARGGKRDAPQPKWSWPFHCMSSGGPSVPHTAAAGLTLPSTLLLLPAALNSVDSCGCEGHKQPPGLGGHFVRMMVSAPPLFSLPRFGEHRGPHCLPYEDAAVGPLVC